MIKSIRNFLIIFFILQQLKLQISQFDKNGLIGFLRTNFDMYMYTIFLQGCHFDRHHLNSCTLVPYAV